ncbi:hypothetical protein QBC39DRAFT_377204, partial [Podospora conica]
ALKQEAELNKERNETEFKQWVNLHAASDIAAINAARMKLRRLGFVNKSVRPIKDDRAPKRTANAYINFVKSRWASGDYDGVKVPEAGKSFGTEWNALSSAERAAFDPKKA